MTDRISTAELRKLLANATPGEWNCNFEGPYGHDGVGTFEIPQTAEDASLIAATPQLADEVIELREALEFYADIKKYPAPLTGGQGDLWLDCGQIARAALNHKEAEAIEMSDKEPIGRCEHCSRIIYEGNPHYMYSDGPVVCEDHAPLKSEIVKELREWVKSEPFIEDECLNHPTAAEVIARANQLDAEIATGGDCKVLIYGLVQADINHRETEE